MALMTEERPAAPAPAGRSPLLGSLARLVTNRPVWTILVSIALLVLAGWYSAPLGDRMSGGGFTPQDAESAQAERLLTASVYGGRPNLILITGYDRSFAGLKMASAMHDRIKNTPGVDWVQSYWDNQDPDMRSLDGQKVAVAVRLAGNEHDAEIAAKTLVPEWEAFSGWDFRAFGEAQYNLEAVEQSEKDLISAEVVGLPLAILILWLVLRRLRATLLPFAVSLVAITETSAFLMGLTHLVEVSTFAMNILTALGFGLAIDYSLLLISRYREEIGDDWADKEAVKAAVRIAIERAGRTILFSAVTVSISLTALIFFPLPFLKSMAYAAVPITMFCAITSVTLLPAMLVLWGGKLFRPTRLRLPGLSGSREGMWHNWALTVMKRPVLAATPVVILLLFLATPFQDARFGFADWETVPKSMSAYQVGMMIREEFPELDRVAIEVATVGMTETEARNLANTLSTYPGVYEVHSLRGKHRDGKQYYGRTFVRASTDKNLLYQMRQSARVDQGTTRLLTPEPDRRQGEVNWLSVKIEGDRNGKIAQNLVREIRATPIPSGTEMYAGGDPAIYIDTLDGVVDGIAPALAVIVLCTLLLLFLFTGSLLAPVKALIMNLFSLFASFGAMVYIFQEGHLKWLVGDFYAPGYLDCTMPIMLFCIAFGLSMDYEIFLLSRIREYYDSTGDNEYSVAMGLEKTGKLFTAASLIMASAFGVLIISEYALLKLYGLGVALAVVVDAVLIRAVLVPAFMRIAGDWNWWAPKPLAAVYKRFGIRD
jgi:RND superfamily putative drug exporter